MAYHEEEIKRILDAYLQGRATDEERKLLDQFFDQHRDEVNKESLNAKEYLLLEQQIQRNIHKSIKPRSAGYPYLSLAAAVSLIVVVAFALLYYRSTAPATRVEKIALITKGNQRGQKSTIILPDGSTVRLNANSTISFPEKFTGKTREVALKGEGWFEVRHNPDYPFIVSTAEAKTTVLGTTFNVKALADQSTVVTLVTGKVEVGGQATRDKVHLKPGQQAVVGGHARIDTASVDVTRFIEWKDNVLAFSDTPLSDAIVTLEDWYGVDVNLENRNLEGCRITGRYEAESLENVLESFRFMLKGNYVIKGRNVTISGKGCRF